MTDYFLYPSSLYAINKPCQIKTILGSCVAVCIYDQILKIGGMNHFLLPFWNGKGLPSPKYGNIATEKLIDKMLLFGSRKNNLQAKIFGGSNLFYQNKTQFKIGKRNIEIAHTVLSEYRIPIIKENTGGHYGRKIIFQTDTGIVYHKLLKRT